MNSTTLLVTESCNIDCSFCYQSSKNTKNMDWAIAEKALLFLKKNSDKTHHICFSGGEPLLNFSLIKKVVEHNMRNEDPISYTYSLLTNGTLIDKYILGFLKKNKFSVQISFLTKDQSLIFERDYKNSFLKNIALLIRSEEIQLSANNVITPDNVNSMTEIVINQRKFGIENIGISIDYAANWDSGSIIVLKTQVELLIESEIQYFKKYGKLSAGFFNLEERDTINGCGAGSNQISITSNGDIWGCELYYFYYKNFSNNKKLNKYFLGNISEITKSGPEFKNKISNYIDFTGDKYKTDSIPCFLCPYLRECHICPAIFYPDKKDRSLFLVPDHVCEINKIRINSNRKLRIAIKNI